MKVRRINTRTRIRWLIIIGLLLALFSLSVTSAWRLPDSPLYLPLTLFRGTYDNFVLLVTLGAICVYCMMAWMSIMIQVSGETKQFYESTVRHIPCLLIAAVALISLFVGGMLINPLVIKSNRTIVQHGNTIVAALEKYKSARGGYPEKLTALVPEYLPEIPKTGLYGEREFNYRKLASPPHHPGQHNEFTLEAAHNSGLASTFRIRYIKDMSLVKEITPGLSETPIGEHWIVVAEPMPANAD